MAESKGVQGCLQRSIIGEILPVFQRHSVITASNITNVYAQVKGRTLSMKAYGYKKLAEFYEEADFFTELDKGEVTISKDKLLHYLLNPLANDTPLERSFERVNGFPPDILCNFCGVDSLSQLIKTARPRKKRGTVQHDPLPTPAIPAVLIPVQQSFPNNGIHPKDESYLPALPGHPGIVLPNSIPNLPSRPVLRQGERLPVTMMEQYISEFIIWASSQGKHLPVCVVTAEIKNIVKQKWNKIKALEDFDRLYKRLDVFIRDFCWLCPFTSLYELERTILKFEKVASFEELRMGPILKHPVLQDMFKIPDDLSHVPKITTYDILETLNAFVNKHKKGDNIWDKLEEFMDFFAKKYSVPSPQYLCVRVSSYRMALSCNFKFRTSQRQIRERRELEAATKVNQTIDFEIESLKRSLRRMSQNERDLSNKSPVTIIEDIFTISKDVLPPQLQSRLFTFFSLVLKDNRARKLFTAAVYQSAYGVQQYKQDQERVAYSSSTFVQSQEMFCHKTQSELRSAIVAILQHSQFPISLKTLARVEQDLLSRMSVSYFSLFHHGSFLEFIAESDELLKCVGGRHIGERSVTSDFRRNRIFGFLNQMKQTFDDQKLLESALKLQFCVSDVEELACGGVDKLISDAKAISPSSTSRSHVHPIISYTVPLVVNDHPNPELVTAQSGYLGPQSPTDAFARLHKAPLLSDLSEWTQWDLVFAPYLGGLGDFLMKQNDLSFSGSKETVHALQDSSGRLLKIDPKSDREAFVAAVETLDPIDAAGHLVSMAVTQTSINLMSTQLLAKCVTTKLELVEGEEENAMLPERFVFHCLQRIPLELCDTLGKQVFIDPLRKVKSATTVNKLIELCVTDSQRCLLQALGIKLGINEWIIDFKEMKTTCLLSTSKKQHPNKSIGKAKAPSTVKPPAHIASSEVLEVLHSPDTNSQLSDSPVDSTSATSINRAIGVDKARRVIVTIREEEFGIGLELNQQQLKIANKQKEREGRGLQRLSQELYSKDTHFVLELIQNADDNTYNLSKPSVPTVKFILHNDCISVLNNEVGFSERNIRAICDVGKSTKDPSRSGYIGQKGIGFKSVFRVTNKPEIHSSGFHIQFDTTSGPIGYILPEWIQQSFIDGKIASSELAKWTTQIVLPLRGESNVSQNMAKKFQDIQPSLLLFLNRLRSIIIYDTESDEEKIMVRTDEEDGVTMISHDEGIDRWLVTRKELTDASHYKPGVQTTELAIAFPLPEDLDSLPSARDLQSQQVFAFLPLRSYGFRFIVQGDFDLPSSREDVNEDSTWNQWLRENIPSLFMEASESIKGLSQLDMVKAISLFVQFIPLDGEVHDFFKPVTSQILRLLKGSKCLPTDPLDEVHSSSYDPFRKIMHNDDLDFEEAEVTWRQPSQLVSVAHDFIRDCIPQSVLASSLNLYYLNSSLAPRIGPDLCSHLGIGTISVDHLIEVANCVLNGYYSHLDSTSDASDTSSDDDESTDSGSPFRCLVSWISYWLACVYTVLDEGKSIVPQALANLKKLKIIPLMDETLVALDEVTVFFPPSNDADIDTDYKMIFTELKTVDDSLLETGDHLIQGKVYQMLSIKLGIKELNELDIIDHHIIPQFKSQAHQKKDRILILYLKFIKKCMDRCLFGEAKVSQIMEQLKICVQVVTNKGIKSPSKDVVHFSSEYKEQWDLSKLFPGVKWTLLSSKYLERNTDVQSWKKFFIELGITAGLAVERINHSIDPTHQTEKVFIWNVSNWKRSQDGQYTVRDYYCREFDEIVDSVSSMRADRKFQEMESLANMLDKGWDARYKQYFVAQCFDGSNTHQLDEVLSSFGASVRDKPWLPAVDMQQQPYSPTPVLKGIDLYTHSKENTSLLDNHVPYLGVSLQNKDLLKAIKVKSSVTPSALMDHLKQWCVASRDDSFTASVDHMGEVYIFFNKHISDDIEKAFGEENLIFIPSNTPQEYVKGEFRSIHDCCWTDKTTVIYRMLRRKQTPPSYLPFVLSYYYNISNEERQTRKIKHAFLALGVNELIKLKGLASLLDYNASLAPTPTADLVDNFTSIAHVVIESIFIPQRPDDNPMQHQSSELSSINEPNRSYFIGEVKGNKVFPTTCKKWANVENLLVDDAPEVSKHFLNSEKVYFLQWSQASNSDLHKQQEKRFIEICRIPLLSQNVHIAFTPVGIRPFDELKRLFHHLIPLVQLYFLSQLPDVLTIEHHQHICDFLAKLRFFSTIELNCSYTVRDELRVVKARQCHVDIEETSAVFAVVDPEGKYLEKSSLAGVIKDIVSSHQSIMDSKFERFLQNLITDEPTSEESKKSVIERYELAEETAEFPIWSVDLPNTFVKVKKACVDLEMEENDSNDSADEDSVVDDTDTGLRAWPPKASAMVNSSSKKPTRIPTKDYETVPSTKDVMTSNDIAEMRRQAGQQDDTRQTTSSPALCDSKHQSSHKHHKGSMSAAVESLSTTQPNTGGTTRHPDKEGATLKENHPIEGKSSSGKNNENREKGDLDLKSKSQSRQSSHLEPDDKKAVSPIKKMDFQNMEALEISHLMHNIPLEAAQRFDMPSDIEGTKQESLIASGKWGEMFAHLMFKKQGALPNGLKIASIEWENEKDESGLPYDIKVTVQDGTVYFVEVKSTSSSNKELIPFSWKELKFAKEKAESYVLIRVYNALSSSKVIIKWLPDMYQVIESNQSVRLFLKL